MTQLICRVFLSSVLSTFLLACSAQRPIVYPNSAADSSSREAAERAVDECMERAEQFASLEQPGADAAEDAALSAGTSATVGAAGGAAGGAIVGRAAQGAAAGAAGGAAASLTRSLLRALFTPRKSDLRHQRLVNRCLRDKGYETVGWK